MYPVCIVTKNAKCGKHVGMCTQLVSTHSDEAPEEQQGLSEIVDSEREGRRVAEEEQFMEIFTRRASRNSIVVTRSTQ